MINKAASSTFVRGLTLGTAVLAVIGLGIALWGILSAQSRISWLTEVSKAHQAYLSSMKDMETAYRAYVIVPSSDFLEPYGEAAGRLPAQEEQLRAATAQAGIGAAEAEQLFTKSAAVSAYAQKLLAARQTSLEAAQNMVREREGKEIMDEARNLSEAIEASGQGVAAGLAKRVWNVYVPLAVICGLLAILASILLGVFAVKARKVSMRARELLGKVMERAPVGIALLDGKRQVASMNATFGDMIGARSRTDVKVSQISPELAKYVDSTLGGGSGTARNGSDPQSVDELEFEVSVGNQLKAFKYAVFPVTLTDNEGRFQRGAGVVLSDITQQREWEEDLQAARDAAEGANRAKSAFIANMSHELRTPLTAVLGYCELVEEDLRDLGEERVLSDLNKISINAKHLLGLINDVLDLSKIEAQKMDVNSVEFTVSSLLSEVEAATGSLIAKKNNTLELSAGSDFTMQTDDLKLKQILLNLISNAAKFTENGKITLNVDKQDSAAGPLAVFKVVDSGIGMTPEQVAGLFQRFVQADETTTRKYGGTGLGLALTRALAIMLGGKIEVASEQGKGTTFTLSVPAVFHAREVDLNEVHGAADHKHEQADLRAGQPGTVLVVDDDPSARDLLTRHLTSEGFSVVTASTGTEALESLQRQKPVAVLLDVMMPGMDGWHVLKSIRENPETEKLPVIMQTVLDDTRIAYALGANSYLKKPVRRADLVEALGSAVSAPKGKHVLIVDDDVEASRRLQVMLKRDGWIVDHATDGAMGLERIKAQAFDLVLVDLVMPGMDGHALVREIRADSSFDKVTIVIMTAQDINTDAVRKLKKSTSGIVQKGSMPLSELVADLRSLTGQSNTQGTN